MVEPKDKRVQSLLAGEKVRLFGEARFYVFCALHTLGSLLTLVFLGLIIKDFKTQEWPAMGLFEILHIAFYPAVSLFLLYSTAVYWGSLLFGAVRFADDYFTFWDWRNQSYEIPFSNLLALWEEKGFIARLCYTRPEASRQTACLNLRATMRWKRALAEAIRNELLGKGSLTKLGPMEDASDKRAVIWNRPDLPDFQIGKYEISQWDKHKTLVWGIGILGLLLLWLTYWDSWSFGNVVIFLLLLLGVGLLIGLWALERRGIKSQELLAVAWDAGIISLYIQNNSRQSTIIAQPWSDITRIVLPAYPGAGVADLQVSGKESPYKLLLTENINCLALLNILRNKGLISWEQAAD